jgi:hypothetical protein
MYKSITTQTRTFHILGGGGTSSSLGISAPSGYNFSVSNFNKITRQTAQRRIVRAGCFLRSHCEERSALARGALPRVTVGHCERSEAIQGVQCANAGLLRQLRFLAMTMTLAQLLRLSVSTGCFFSASCFNTLATTQYYRKQPANAPFAGAASSHYLRSGEGEVNSCKLL